MKTDSIFYRLFQEFPNIFFELIGNPLEAVSDYQFSSVEVKQTAFRIDGVFIPAENNENPIYFVEVQFQPDAEFYSRFFTEIFLHLRQNQLQNDWCAVVIYPSQEIDTGDIRHYHEFFVTGRVRRIYLNQLDDESEQSIGISTIKLVVLPKARAVEQARSLIGRIRQEVRDELQQRKILELLETLLFYKFPNLSQQEIQEMFGLSELKQTRVYQEAKEEGRLEAKLEVVPCLLAMGLTVEQIAEALGLSAGEVRQAAQQHLPKP